MSKKPLKKSNAYIQSTTQSLPILRVQSLTVCKKLIRIINLSSWKRGQELDSLLTLNFQTFNNSGLRRLFNVERRGSSLYKHNFEIPIHV